MDSRPNIVLIISDQQRYDAVGYTGNQAIQTPSLDALAGNGAVFNRCYATSTVCAPSRASMLTGMFPSTHGLWANGVDLPPSLPLVSRLLAEAGYDCGLVGKLHLSATQGGRDEVRREDGFRVFDWANSPTHESPANDYAKWLSEFFPDQAAVLHSTSLEDVKRWPTEAHFSRWVSERSVDFIQDRNRDSPFFLVAGFVDPHHPFAAPDEFVEKYIDIDVPEPIDPPTDPGTKPSLQQGMGSYTNPEHKGYESLSHAEHVALVRSYYAMVSLMDQEIGRIAAAIDREGLTKDTLFLFTSDHGELLGDHGLMLKGPIFYEGAVRVPLILHWPEKVHPGIESDALVQGLDIFGTILEAAGVKRPNTDQSVDLVGVLEHSQKPRPWAMTQYRDSGYPLRPPVLATMIRDETHKAVFYHGNQGTLQGELYHLTSDPDEKHNVWDDPDHSSKRLALAETLVDALVASEDRGAPRVAIW